jgi:hypothetical protein
MDIEQSRIPMDYPMSMDFASRNPPKIDENPSLGPWIVPWYKACQMRALGLHWPFFFDFVGYQKNIEI